MTYSPNKRKLTDPEIPNGVYNRPYTPLAPITFNRNTLNFGYSPISSTLIPPKPTVPIYSSSQNTLTIPERLLLPVYTFPYKLGF